MLTRLISPRLVLAFALFVGAALLPVTAAPGGGLRSSSLCGASSSLTTCCPEHFNVCSGSGAGVGWYDTGCYGLCDSLYGCVWDPT